MKIRKQLGYCSTCLNRSFNARHGISCGLTEELPEFEGECESYSVDKDEYEVFMEKHQRAISILKGMKGTVEISSSWTVGLFFVSLIFVLFVIFISYIMYRNGSELTNVLLGGGLFLVMIIGVSLFYASLCTVTISLEQESISFKRIFGRTKTYPIGSILKTDIFVFRRSRFTTCVIQLENKDEKSFTIHNVRSYFDKNQAMADHYINAVQNYGALKRFID